MSGAELPIAVVSFFFQAFAGCIQGYELIADACRLEDDAQALLVKFKIEEHRLLNWGKLVQLDYTEEQLLLNHMSRGMIMDILHQQQKLLASFGRLDNRYGRLRKPLLQEQRENFVVDSDRLLENGASMSENSKGSVQFPPAEELVIKALEWLRKSRDVPKRIRWASWDHRKMEALIVKLSDYNDKMHDALDRAQMDTLLEMQTRTNYQIVLLNRQMENMVQIWQSERIAHRPQGMITDLEDSEYDFINGISGPNTRSLTQPLGALAQQKFVHLAIEDSHYVSEEWGNLIDLPRLADNIRETELALQDISTIDDEPFPDDIEEGDRTEATWKGASVWIEWKPNELAGPGQPDGQVDPKIHSRVKKLAALLKQNNRKVRFRAPHCLGYFVDESEDRESRFGLVFEKPDYVPPSTQPTTLRQLIESNRQNAHFEIPSLTDRINLMRLLAETVERLHAVDWLHKGLRSGNILFFLKEGKDGLEVNYTDPYISGFDYSRPATNDDLTERPTDNAYADIYRHPTVQSTGNREESGTGRESYKKSFDLYSLGIVLLEIAYWKTIDQILAIDLEKARPKQTWPVKDRLLNREPQHLKFVKSYLGNTVESVIRACLEGPEAFGLDRECDERRGVVAAALQTAFAEKVVKRLAMMKGL
ncbi:prion-inhibition and propagation-domain-containing protein [Phaeosphaeriaceae sp. PMI808]|nr:prion-inhibition and propagation-domain-containing protein [Phaeosphaeriaceae sp. PMI808]